MNILIVEDDMVTAMVISSIIEPLNHRVRVAGNGKDALVMIGEQPVDIVISDWTMPEMDGIKLCTRIRIEEGDRYTYFILATARDQHDDVAEAYGAGIDDFLAKPIDPAELCARLSVAERILNMQTHMRASMNVLESANRRFAELYYGLPIICFTIDPEGYVREWNKAAINAFGEDTVDILQHRGWSAVSSETDRTRISDALSKMRTGQTVEGVQWTYDVRHAPKRTFTATLLPVRDNEEKVVAAIIAHNEIAVWTKSSAEILNQSPIRDGTRAKPNTDSLPPPCLLPSLSPR